jgi:hypothetical protein
LLKHHRDADASLCTDLRYFVFEVSNALDTHTSRYHAETKMITSIQRGLMPNQVAIDSLLLAVHISIAMITPFKSRALPPIHTVDESFCPLRLTLVSTRASSLGDLCAQPRIRYRAYLCSSSKSSTIRVFTHSSRLLYLKRASCLTVSIHFNKPSLGFSALLLPICPLPL